MLFSGYVAVDVLKEAIKVAWDMHDKSVSIQQ